jgi:hypothetical protein
MLSYNFNIGGGHAEVKRRLKYYDKNNYFFESVERFWRRADKYL